MSASVLASAKGSVAELALVLLLWCEGGFSRGRGWGFSGGRRNGGDACTWHRGRWSVAWVRVGAGFAKRELASSSNGNKAGDDDGVGGVDSDGLATMGGHSGKRIGSLLER